MMIFFCIYFNNNSLRSCCYHSAAVYQFKNFFVNIIFFISNSFLQFSSHFKLIPCKIIITHIHFYIFICFFLKKNLEVFKHFMLSNSKEKLNFSFIIVIFIHVIVFINASLCWYVFWLRVNWL